MKLTKNFTVAELACQCECGFGTSPDDYAPGFLDFLQLVRDIYARPMNPTSCARCSDHNRAVGGVNQSAHLRAAAIDVGAGNGFDRHMISAAFLLALVVKAGEMTREEAIEILAKIAEIGVGGLGLAKGFVHFDIDTFLPRPSAWGYPPKRRNS